MADMAYSSPSLRVSGRTSPQVHANIAAPVTPVHSPHHSVTSSASTRTPIHTLSIHEYRRQQNTPNLQTATPPGRTLRRKAAAPSLNPLQSDRSVQALRSTLAPNTRALHSSQSAQQLHSRRSPFQQQQHLADQLIRAQSAEPRTQGGSVSSISTTTSNGKLGHFKSRKRLPKPSAASIPPPVSSRLAPSKPAASRQPRFSPTCDLPTESSHSSGIYTPHSTSTFSLSRFPRPPHLIDPSLSPPHNDIECAPLNTLSYASVAPATPPATPAILHYRGASFDLVNPHDSLILHDIVTPSREFDSSEYLPVFAAGEPFPDFAEMAPKRALYGDFNAAHAGIMRRADDSFGSSNLDLPLPPTPAAISPDSSTYTSPLYSPESVLAPPPLAVQQTTNDSRFSLKQLTRTLTKRLGKTPEKAHDRELQQLRDPQLSIATISMEGEFPRPLQETYVPTPQSAYFPISPTSPVTPTSPISPSFGQDQFDEVELPRRASFKRYDSEPLASLIPEDENSTQIGRVDDPRMSMSEGQLLSLPYYDDLDSIYPSSSIYTSDDKRKSTYQQSLLGSRQSNPFARYSGMDASNLANDYSQASMYGYSFNSRRKLTPLSQEVHGRPGGGGKTDTISKIIDQYDPNLAVDNTLSMQSHEGSQENVQFSIAPASMGQHHDASGLTQFEFGWNRAYENSQSNARDLDNSMDRPFFSRVPPTAGSVGAPPRAPPPLAPPISMADGGYSFPGPEASEMFSNRSSYFYGDTRHLLQMSQAQGFGFSISSQPLQPSSSYSQPGGKAAEPSSSYSQAADHSGSHTPQEALDAADQIFQDVTDKQETEKGIPAMWAKRSSGSMLLVKKAAGNRKSCGSQGVHSQRESQGNEADWESIAGNSHALRDSFDSIADYSSSEGTRNSLGLNSNGSLPSWNERQHSQGFSVYSHPSPLRAHFNPFSSSPPPLRPRGRMEDSRDSSSSALPSSPPSQANVPVFRPNNAHDEAEQGNGGQQNAFAPWADQYAFSDKETQELLASGPNDKIIIDHVHDPLREPDYTAMYQGSDGVILSSSAPVSPFDSPNALERVNTFEKLTVIGPKGNLTGTPMGSRMHETGSSVADTSSPGQELTPGFHSSDYPGFYASPFPVTGSVTTIQQKRGPVQSDHERTPSQVTIFPRSTELEPVIESPPIPGANHRQSVRNSTNFQHAQRRASRTAVPGQTKLRQMILATETARRTLSSADTNFSRFKGGSERPSTSDTHTPLRPKMSVDTVPTVRTLIAHHHSPHLLCPERAASPEEEERRRKLSWAILAVFCLLPPCIILYRVWGDAIMVSVTQGDLGHCTNKSKKVALIGGIVVNVGIVTAIVVPIAVAQALGVA